MISYVFLNRPSLVAPLIALITASLHPDLEAAIEYLKVAFSKGASFVLAFPLYARVITLCRKSETKVQVSGGNSVAIRPVLGAVALKAIRLNEYDDNFFST